MRWFRKHLFTSCCRISISTITNYHGKKSRTKKSPGWLDRGEVGEVGEVGADYLADSAVCHAAMATSSTLSCAVIASSFWTIV